MQILERCKCSSIKFYLSNVLTISVCKSQCEVPMAAWQLSFYFLILTLRLALYIYCVSIKLARCALVSIMAVLFPLVLISTIMGTYYYRTMLANEPTCYPDDASPWSLIMSLCLGWFLSYIYLLLGCTALYNQLDKTRVRYFFRIFTHVQRHDPLLTRLAEADQGEEDDRQERWNDAFEPLNQNG